MVLRRFGQGFFIFAILLVTACGGNNNTPQAVTSLLLNHRKTSTDIPLKESLRS